MNILIVEDDRVLSLMLTKLVERIGHKVVDAVTDGQSAIKSVHSNNIDLILMDIMIEGEIDGIETMHKIRENHAVPVIYVTGNSDQRTIERAQETNFTDYLVKPITDAQLRKALKKASGSLNR